MALHYRTCAEKISSSKPTNTCLWKHTDIYLQGVFLVLWCSTCSNSLKKNRDLGGKLLYVLAMFTFDYMSPGTKTHVRPHFHREKQRTRRAQRRRPNIANEKNTLIDKNTFAHTFISALQTDSLMSLNMGSLRLERGDVGYPFLKGCWDAPDGPGARQAREHYKQNF